MCRQWWSTAGRTSGALARSASAATSAGTGAGEVAPGRRESRVRRSAERGACRRVGALTLSPPLVQCAGLPCSWLATVGSACGPQPQDDRHRQSPAQRIGMSAPANNAVEPAPVPIAPDSNHDPEDLGTAHPLTLTCRRVTANAEQLPGRKHTVRDDALPPAVQHDRPALEPTAPERRHLDLVAVADRRPHAAPRGAKAHGMAGLEQTPAQLGEHSGVGDRGQVAHACAHGSQGCERRTSATASGPGTKRRTSHGTLSTTCSRKESENSSPGAK